MKIDSHTHSVGVHPALVMGKQALGIHPWELQKTVSLQAIRKRLDQLMDINPQLMAIGECGLDRSRADLVSMQEQLTVLEWHFNEARKKNLPLIIHCVRAHSDLVGLLKKNKIQQTIMLHDFNGNEFQIREYLKFDVYFSLGKRGLKNIEKVPFDRLLLETDDQIEMSLELLYTKASMVLGVSMDQLEKQIEENFLRFFSKSHNVRAADFIKNFSA